MKTEKYNRRRIIMTLTLIALVLFQGIHLAANVQAASHASTDVDLSSEAWTLASFVEDLANYDKKVREADKKATLTRLEFDDLQRTANDLKGRVSGVQNASREIIRKLKAAGQWDNIDAIVLANIPDARFQDFVRRDGFKRTLEEIASGISNLTNEMSNPLRVLRRKVSANKGGKIQVGNLAALVVCVAY
jgi:hypothetical protein